MTSPSARSSAECGRAPEDNKEGPPAANPGAGRVLARAPPGFRGLLFKRGGDAVCRVTIPAVDPG
jgi:hypothetical protein